MPMQQPDTVAAARSPRLIRKLNALSILISASMLLLVGFGLWQAREDAWEAARLSSENLITAMSRNVANNMELAEQAVVATANGVTVPGIWGFPAKLQDIILFNKGRSSPYLDRLFVLDSEGRLIAESTRTLPGSIDFSDRDYFRKLRAADGAATYLSAPLTSRFSKVESLVLARRIETADGKFAGIAAGVMPLSRMERSISGVVIGPRSAINLFLLDGSILARKPAIKQGAKRNLAGTPTFERMKAEGRGSFVGRSAVDGEERLYSFGRPGNVPMLLDVAISTSEILSPWWYRALPPLLATLALCSGILLLAMLVQRELLHRQKVEKQLEELASLDGLTGLSNRRGFDQALAREWRRARRTGDPVSLMIIDADHFKAYNDLYGHVAGDGVLRQIADAMRQSVKRAADQIARIGGEEFAILLPDTDLQGALRCAATLLDNVASADIAHRGHPDGRVSVSIGVASLQPAEEEEGQLVRVADAALYRAKANGRNQVVAA